MYQNLSVTISQADLEAVFAAITTLEQKLNFLIMLDAAERRALIKLGSRSADFVKDALECVDAAPQCVPAGFNIDEFKKDAALFDILTRIKARFDMLADKLEHTYMASGNEAMTASLDVYSYVRTAAKRMPGLESHAQKLQDRFRSQGRRKSTNDDANNTPKGNTRT